jgi:hypothetical protein
MFPPFMGCVSQIAGQSSSDYPAMLEHDPEKWKPVFRKDHAQTKRYR